ncbi:MAG: aminotransferase class I/II-fold pyridoxal phosphate-dependent enzyme, partial [Oscillospiraceae bacterium]
VILAYHDAAHEIVQYPDPKCTRLIHDLANVERLPASFFLCGNGAADLIFRLCYAKKPKRTLLLSPTFSEYERALTAARSPIDFFPLMREQNFSVTAEILPLIKGHDLLIFCNPNNPTGQITEKNLMKQILLECEKNDCLFVVDECFMDFVETENASMKDQLETSSHLLILKAFTKIFAIPGLRLGYCISKNRALLTQMELSGQSWSVSVPAEVCGIAALSEEKFSAKTRQFVRQQRKKLRDGLKAFGFTVYDSHTNYLLFYTDLLDLDSKLAENGFLIRNCENFRGLESGFYRIAIRTESENTALLDALQKILNA